MISLSLTTFLVTALIACVGLMLLNKSAFHRILHLGKSQAGNLGRAAERADPVGQMRQAADDAKAQVSIARDALVKSKALKESLERQVAADKNEIARAKSKLAKYKEDGRSKDERDVISTAEKMAKAMKSLETNEKQLELQTKLYNETLESAKKAASKIAGLEQHANNLESRLETSAAQAQLAETINSYNSSNVNSALNKASKYAELAEQRIAENGAKLQVDTDLGLNTDDDDAEVSLTAASILDDFDSPNK